MKRKKPFSGWNFVFMIPLFLFLILSFFSWKRGQEGVWHQRCVDFWQKKQWGEIMAMGENLLSAGKADTEAIYFAMQAAVESRDLESAKTFGEGLVNQRVLNSKMEKGIQEIVTPDSILSVIRLHRTDITMAIFLVLSAFSIILIKKKVVLPWISIIAIIGIVVLKI